MKSAIGETLKTQKIKNQIKMNEHFEISDDYIALNKLLKASGLCGTGGHAKIIIDDGLVTVDGEVETRRRRKIKDGMVVKYNYQTLKVLKKL